MLGTYHEYKGHSFLLEAFAQIRERHATTELNMYGDGSEADRVRIEGLIDRFGLRECAFLHGFVTDPDALIRNADVLVLPSQAHESFGLTIVEAMARGVPVVATRVGGIPEVLEDGVQGFVCSPSDASAFAAAISRLLSSEELRRDLGAAGRRRYEQHFRAEHMSKAYHSLLCS
jgi:glycosyltransferase involved in cell wall biosynthesis